MSPLNGLDFILSHFPNNEEEPLFPRTVSTAITENKQCVAYSKEHALEYFEAANWIDCRINAYPSYDLLGGKGLLAVGYIPRNWLLFVDQERGDIRTTLHNIRMLLGGGYPTVLWSGRGYHIYLPLLITSKEFLSNRELAIQYLRFIEKRVSNWQNDRGHYPSFKSGMLRIPGSFNGKCLLEDNKESSEVRLLQKWDGCRVSPDAGLLEQFHQTQQRMRLRELKREMANNEKMKQARLSRGRSQEEDPLTEFLIFESSGVADGRKNMLYYVVARYLVRRGLDYNSAKSVCWDWLVRCNNMSKLNDTDQYFQYHINHCIKDAIDNNKEPYPVEYLKTLSIEAYEKFIAEYKDKSRQTQSTTKSPAGSPSYRGGETGHRVI